MPGRPHHSDKWHSCVQKVMAKGDHDMQSAAAICTQSLQDAGTPIFEGAESRSLLEIKMLSEFYPQVIADALRAAANPEGINQYTSGGSHAKDAKEVSNSAYQASTKANEKRGTGQEKADRHSDAAAAHGKAADAHAAASKAAKTSITKDYHNQLAASHRAQAENHTRAAGIFAGLEGNNLREIRLLGATGQVRTEMVDGREHLVVPVIALMEGVIHAVNAEVPEFVPASVLTKAAASWVGKPIVVGHPKMNGRQCSASMPGMIEAHGFGTIRSSSMKGNKLTQEVLVDPQRLKTLKQERLLADLRENKRVEVSVGAFVITNDKNGEWNNKRYAGQWVEATGDHLAFLPGGRGACSIDMGCGAHRAAEGRVYEVTPTELRLAADGEPDSEEAAELVSYQTLRTLMDQIGNLWDEGSKIVDNLIAEETDDPTETDAEEEAEEEVEAARVQSLQSLCSSMYGVLSSVMSVCSGLLMPDTNGSPVRYMAGKTIDCPTCDGTGEVEGKNGKMVDCPTCDGTGKMMRTAEAALKALIGARHSTKDTKIIQGVHDHAVALGAACDRSNFKTMSGSCGCKKEEPQTLETIRHEGGRWNVYSQDGTRRLASHMTKEGAEEQQKAIQRSLERQNVS